MGNHRLLLFKKCCLCLWERQCFLNTMKVSWPVAIRGSRGPMRLSESNIFGPTCSVISLSTLHLVSGDSWRLITAVIICKYGALAKLVSDRGTHLVNSLIQSLCDIFVVKRHLSSPYHPCSNAVCEHFNSFLSKSLWSYINDTQSDWPGLIPGLKADPGHEIHWVLSIRRAV